MSEDKIRILSYNFFLRPPLICNSFGGDLKEQRMKAFRYELKNYDIVCFQEIFIQMTNRPEKLIKICMEEGFEFYNLSPKPLQTWFYEWPFTNAGLQTVSRYPIVDNLFIGYDHSSSIDVSAWKGGMYSEVLLPGKPEIKLHIFNTHLQAQYNIYDGEMKIENTKKLKKSKKSLNVRVTQICQFRQLIDHVIKEKGIKNNDPSNIIIIAGDMNINARRCNIPKKLIEEFTPEFEKFRADFDKIQRKGENKSTYNEYEYFIDIMTKNGADRMIDLKYESYGEHPITMGEIIEDENGKKVPIEDRLTHKKDQMSEKSIDYCFIMQTGVGKNIEEMEEKMKETCKSCKVNKFLVEGQKYKQLSDHFGVEFVLHL